MKQAMTQTFCRWINDPKTKHYFLAGLQSWLLVSLLAGGVQAILLGATWLIVNQDSGPAVNRVAFNVGLPVDAASNSSGSREATRQLEAEKTIKTGVWTAENGTTKVKHPNRKNAGQPTHKLTKNRSHDFGRNSSKRTTKFNKQSGYAKAPIILVIIKPPTSVLAKPFNPQTATSRQPAPDQTRNFRPQPDCTNLEKAANEHQLEPSIIP